MHHGFGDEYVVGERAVFGLQVCVPFAYDEGAYKLLVAALQDFCDLCFANVAFAAGQECRLDAISVHGVHRVALGNENGFCPVVGLECVLAVGLAVEQAFHDLCGRVKLVLLTSDFLEIIVQQKIVDTIHAQQLGWVGGKSQFSPDAACIHDFTGVIAEQVNNHVQELCLAQIPATMLFICHISYVFMCKSIKNSQLSTLNSQLFYTFVV